MTQNDTLPASSRRIEIEGSTLNVFEFGAGEPVVLGSSYLWDIRMWRPQIEALSKRYRVIVPELWGSVACKMRSEKCRSDSLTRNRDLVLPQGMIAQTS